jgi:hypothetical protein
VLGAGLVLAVPTVRMAWRTGPALLGYSNPRIELASAIGILPYHMGDLALRLAAGKPTIGEPERQRVIRFLAEHARNTQAPSPLFGVARGKNLIVINAEAHAVGGRGGSVSFLAPEEYGVVGSVDLGLIPTAWVCGAGATAGG